MIPFAVGMSAEMDWRMSTAPSQDFTSNPRADHSSLDGATWENDPQPTQQKDSFKGLPVESYKVDNLHTIKIKFGVTTPKICQRTANLDNHTVCLQTLVPSRKKCKYVHTWSCQYFPCLSARMIHEVSHEQECNTSSWTGGWQIVLWLSFSICTERILGIPRIVNIVLGALCCGGCNGFSGNLKPQRPWSLLEMIFLIDFRGRIYRHSGFGWSL